MMTPCWMMASDISRNGEPRAEFDFPDHLGFQLTTMLFEQRAEAEPVLPQSDGEKDLIRAGQIRAGVLNDAAQRLERLPLRLQDRTHAAVEREAAEVGTPCHPHTREAAIQGLGNHRGIPMDNSPDRVDQPRPSRSGGRPCRRRSAPSAPSHRIRATAWRSGPSAPARRWGGARRCC